MWIDRAITNECMQSRETRATKRRVWQSSAEMCDWTFLIGLSSSTVRSALAFACPFNCLFVRLLPSLAWQIVHVRVSSFLKMQEHIRRSCSRSRTAGISCSCAAARVQWNKFDSTLYLTAIWIASTRLLSLRCSHKSASKFYALLITTIHTLCVHTSTSTQSKLAMPVADAQRKRKRKQRRANRVVRLIRRDATTTISTVGFQDYIEF